MLKNRHLVALAVIAFMIALATPSFAGLEDGLRNYWDLDDNLVDWAQAYNDDGDPTTPSTASTVADDGVFDGANGVAGISYGAGLFNGGIDQNGAVAQNDGFVRVTRSDDTLYGSTSTVSTSMWVKAAGFDTNWQTMLAHGEGAQYRIARRGGDVPAIASYAGGSGDIPTSAGVGPPIDDGEWHHIVAISNGGVETQLWVDGGLVATGDPPTIDDQGNSNPADPDLFIGANPQTGAQNREFWGEIDDVGQWDRVLDDGEIAMIYDGGRQGWPLKHYVPEPTSATLLLFGLLGLGFRRRR